MDSLNTLAKVHLDVSATAALPSDISVCVCVPVYMQEWERQVWQTFVCIALLFVCDVGLLVCVCMWLSSTCSWVIVVLGNNVGEKLSCYTQTHPLCQQVFMCGWIFKCISCIHLRLCTSWCLCCMCIYFTLEIRAFVCVCACGTSPLVVDWQR